MIKNLRLTQRQLIEAKIQLNDHLVEFNNDTVFFVAIYLTCRITAYKSGKVIFQGNDAEQVSQRFAYLDATDSLESAGSDEVGTGDYFGPVIVCACAIAPEHHDLISRLGVADSKIIADEKILVIGATLIKHLPHSILILGNRKYNEVRINNNLNQIKAKLHNRAFLNLQHKMRTLPKLVVIDQFTPEKNYFAYLSQEPVIFSDLIFATKAESKYPAVACASIIARFVFLQEFEKMNAKYNFYFPKGAGIAVDKAIIEFNQLYPHDLENVAKIHFKNTTKALKENRQ